MKQNPYPIESVEIAYNGKHSAFRSFLTALLHDYLAADPLVPEQEAKTDDKEKSSVFR